MFVQQVSTVPNFSVNVLSTRASSRWCCSECRLERSSIVAMAVRGSSLYPRKTRASGCRRSPVSRLQPNQLCRPPNRSRRPEIPWIPETPPAFASKVLRPVKSPQPPQIVQNRPHLFGVIRKCMCALRAPRPFLPRSPHLLPSQPPPPLRRSFSNFSINAFFCAARSSSVLWCFLVPISFIAFSACSRASASLFRVDFSLLFVCGFFAGQLLELSFRLESQACFFLFGSFAASPCGCLSPRSALAFSAAPLFARSSSRIYGGFAAVSSAFAASVAGASFLLSAPQQVQQVQQQAQHLPPSSLPFSEPPPFQGVLIAHFGRFDSTFQGKYVTNSSQICGGESRSAAAVLIFNV